MAQTVAFASFIVAVGLTADLEKGIVDRMRSLPINPAAVLVGRSISSLAALLDRPGRDVADRSASIGWRIHTNIFEALLGYLLLLGWGFAMIWVGIWVGSAMRSVEAVNGVMFATMFPITFLANTFAPTDRMPPSLRFVAEWNPISVADPGRARAVGQRLAAAPRAPPSRCTTRSRSPSAGSS